MYIVVRPDGCGDPSLGIHGVGFGDLRFREYPDTSCFSQIDRGAQAGDARSYHNVVRFDIHKNQPYQKTRCNRGTRSAVRCVGDAMSVTAYGVNPTETIDLLKERVRRAKQGRPTRDGRKVALIVEGGAMRGVI